MDKNFEQVKEKQAAALWPVKRLFSLWARTALCVAMLEAAVGLVGNFFNSDSNLLESMLINASVWLIMFLASMGKLTYDKKKLNNLNYSGVCVDAEIEDMVPTAWFRVGNYVNGRIVCSFHYEGKEYKVKSDCYCFTLFQRKEDLYANVYIDRDNPARYSMELFFHK